MTEYFKVGIIEFYSQLNYVRYSDKDYYIILYLYQQNNEAVIHVCDQAKGTYLSQQGKISNFFY